LCCRFFYKVIAGRCFEFLEKKLWGKEKGEGRRDVKGGKLFSVILVQGVRPIYIGLTPCTKI
jgi:hypothetical protein